MLIHLLEGPPITFPSGFGSGSLLEPPCSVSNQQVQPAWEFPWNLLVFHPWAGCQLQEERGFVPVFISSLWHWVWHRVEALSLLVDEWMSGYFFYPPPTNSHKFSQSRQRMRLATGSAALVLRNSRGGESLCVPGHTSDEMCAVSCLIPCSPQLWRCTPLLKNRKRRAGDSWPCGFLEKQDKQWWQREPWILTAYVRFLLCSLTRYLTSLSLFLH